MLETNYAAKNILEKWMAKPLIVGASVSADWSSLSPGKTLALRHTPASQIRTVAQGGTPGVEQWAKVKPADLEGRTSLLAVDLFFWDSVFPNPRASLETLRSVLETAKARNLPLVLGDIPELLPGRQASRRALNDAIRKGAASQENCFVMPFETLHGQVIRQGYIEIHGKKLGLSELVPDGLHLARVAGEFLADVMADTLRLK